jgi:hypothetical protein
MFVSWYEWLHNSMKFELSWILNISQFSKNVNLWKLKKYRLNFFELWKYIPFSGVY